MEFNRVWRSQRVLIDDGRPYFCSATYLPVRSWRFLLSFMLLARRIERKAKQTPGVVAFRLRAQVPRGRFWTLSCWTSREEADAFVREEPHATAVRKFANWAADGAGFAEWESRSVDVDWEDAHRHLEHPTYTYRRGEGKLPGTGAP